eukprot:jgi/Chrzof1/9692/Cz04g12110.t1_PSB27A[v5.2]
MWTVAFRKCTSVSAITCSTSTIPVQFQVFRHLASSDRFDNHGSPDLQAPCSADLWPAPQQAETDISRREAVAAGAAVVLVSLFNVAPAKAFLGFGEGQQREDQYKQDTAAILASVDDAIKLPKDDPARDEKIKTIRTGINSWVAKYRRDAKFSGKPSYGNTYSVLNALAGHYNSFGTQASIPKKRLDRLQKADLATARISLIVPMQEVADAQLLLSRGR